MGERLGESVVSDEDDNGTMFGSHVTGAIQLNRAC
jgi:hypothetical protein